MKRLECLSNSADLEASEGKANIKGHLEDLLELVRLHQLRVWIADLLSVRVLLSKEPHSARCIVY